MILAQSLGASAPPSGMLRGVEGDGTQILSAATDTIAEWSLVDGAAFTHNTAVAPDGTTTASLLKENSANTRHIAYTVITSGVSSNTDYTFSIYAKPASGSRYLEFTFPNDSGDIIYSFLDPLSGVITDSGIANSGANSALYNTRAAKAQNGWWKLMQAFKMNSVPKYTILSLSNRSVYAGSANLGSPTYTGDNTSGVYLWRPKLVAGVNIVW